MSYPAEIIARIIDPHSFMPDDSGDDLVAEMVKQARDAALRKAELVIAAVEELAWNDCTTTPKSGNCLVYQPEVKSGRSTLSERVVDLSQAGLSRPSTHWRASPKRPSAPEEREKILNPYGVFQP